MYGREIFIDIVTETNLFTATKTRRNMRRVFVVGYLLVFLQLYDENYYASREAYGRELLIIPSDALAF